MKNKTLFYSLIALAIASTTSISAFAASKPTPDETYEEPSLPAEAMMSYGGPWGNYIFIKAGDSQKIEFKLKITGDLEIKAGDTIEIWESFAAFYLTPPVGLENDNFDVVERSNADATVSAEFTVTEFHAKISRILAPHPLAEIKVLAGSFKKGDDLYLSFSDPAGSDRRLIAMFRDLGEAQITFKLKHEGDEDSTPIAPPIGVFVEGGDPYRLTVIAPSEVVEGERFDLLVKVEDFFGNLASGVVGPVDLNVGGIRLSPVQFDDPTKPVVHVPISASELAEPITYVHASLENSALEGVSNPIRKKDTPGPRIFWGDLHCHSYDGVEISELVDRSDPRTMYRRAHEINGLDFLAITSHLFDYAPDAIKKWWPLEREGAATNYVPGKFTTFLGFEWRGEAGDHNTVLPGDTDFTFTADNVNAFQFFDEAAQRGALAVAHYGGIMAELEFGDDRTQRLVEIASEHRRSEFLGHRSLALGNRTGFTGSTDDHSGECGGRAPAIAGTVTYPPDLYFGSAYDQGGLTAVFADGNDREKIFGALMDKRTYATSGPRIIVDFDANGTAMGGETEAHDSPSIKLNVFGTKPLDVVSIIRNDETIYEKKVGGDMSATVEFVDTNPPYGENYYYARISQIDDSYAWSGPVWVNQLEVPNPKPYPIVGAWNYDPIPNPSPADEAAANDYREKVEEVLVDVGASRLLVWLAPLKVVDAMDGRYVAFTSYDPFNDTPVRIEYYVDRPYRALRIYAGTFDYGQSR